MDFIVDTNVLIAGVGHWLVRCFGDVCDLVRTVVTDLEVQRFGDATKWTPTKFEELEDRTSYLTASRFLECLQEQHPVWRRLDIEEETALFVASSSQSGGRVRVPTRCCCAPFGGHCKIKFPVWFGCS